MDKGGVNLQAGHPQFRLPGQQAQGGNANAALIKLLAREWRLPAGALSVAKGARNRRKVIAVVGEGPALMAQVERWRVRMEKDDG